eukprot:1158553-Pelagomonas_calceolata.AAC.1
MHMHILTNRQWIRGERGQMTIGRQLALRQGGGGAGWGWGLRGMLKRPCGLAASLGRVLIGVKAGPL